METPSIARSFFEQFLGLGESDRAAFLNDLVTQQTSESEWLEFKCAPDIQGDQVKEDWSEALSGFANTGGGVLIWGIRAAKNPATKIDCASTTCHVPTPAVLESRLRELQHQATDPPVLGVLIESVDDPSVAGRGFVVCLIPESPFRPHRAEYAKRQYYIRAGDSFIVTPVAVLKSLFYPRTKSRLRIEMSVRLNQQESYVDEHYSCTIYNDGPASARDLYVTVTTDREFKQFKLVDGSWDTAPRQIEHTYNRPLHPGGRFTLFLADSRIPVRGGSGLPRHSAHFDILIYATDQERQAVTADFSEHDIINQDTIRGCEPPATRE